MSKIGNIVNTTVDLLTEGGDKVTERLIFKKFSGMALSAAAENGTDIENKDIETVVLQVNPNQITYNEPKIVQKVQTTAPGRFVVFDWGTDLLSLTIEGNTGNLLPGIVQSGFNPLKGLVDNIAAKIDPVGLATVGAGPLSGEAAAIAQNILLKSMSYSELLRLSPKYRVFAKLRKMYQTFDADFDVLTLEMGEVVYRGYFLEFSFTQTAENPWNWKYTVVFIALSNLMDSLKRGDDTFLKNEEIIATNE